MRIRVVREVLALTLVCSIAVALSPTLYAYGESGSEYISGPSGDKVNEWFKGGFSILFYYRNDGPGCGGISSGNYNWANTNAPSGNHLYSFYRDHLGSIWYRLDGGSLRSVTPLLTNPGCNPGQPGDITAQIYSNYIWVDNSAPIIQFDATLNNLHTKDSIYYLTGTASDDNGPISVSVNGEAPTGYISGKSGGFRHSVYLKEGANVFTATATDDAGRSTKSSSITVYKDKGSSMSSSGGSSNTTSQSNTNPQQTQVNSNNNIVGGQNTSEASASTQPIKNPSISTPVKVAAGTGLVGLAGLGIASYMGYIPYRKISSFFTKLIGK